MEHGILIKCLFNDCDEAGSGLGEMDTYLCSFNDYDDI